MKLLELALPKYSFNDIFKIIKLKSKTIDFLYFDIEIVNSGLGAKKIQIKIKELPEKMKDQFSPKNQFLNWLKKILPKYNFNIDVYQEEDVSLKTFYSPELTGYIKLITIAIENKYGGEIFPNNLLGDFIYHITTETNYKKILKTKYIIPKNYNKVENHTKKIFFSIDKNSVKYLANMLRPYSSDKKMLLLILKTNNLKNYTFFRDNDYYKGIFTNKKISINNIDHIEEIK